MITTFFAIDNEDSSLGSFFSECLEDIIDYNNETIKLEILKSDRLQNDICTSLVLENISKFIFLAYSHGKDDALFIKENTPYVSININNDKFVDSFFYACACHSGKILGKNLIENGCSSYIGYNDTFTVWGYNSKPFVECANYGLKLFLQGDDINTIIEKMKSKYDDYINNYDNDIFGAADLLSNKNALVWYGNGKLKLSDLMINKN